MNAQRMADSLGVSYSAFLNRLKELSLLDMRPLSEYIAGVSILEVICDANANQIRYSILSQPRSSEIT